MPSTTSTKLSAASKLAIQAGAILEVFQKGPLTPSFLPDSFNLPLQLDDAEKKRMDEVVQEIKDQFDCIDVRYTIATIETKPGMSELCLVVFLQ